MMRVAARWFLAIVVFSAMALAADQQNKQSTNQEGGGTNSNSPVSGVSYVLTALPTTFHVTHPVVLCYTLVKVDDSPLQPFILQPSSSNNCSTPDDSHPLRAGDHLVVSVDATTTADVSRLKALILNVSSQQGTPINATPVRPTFSVPAGAPTKQLQNVRFLVWPFSLKGDTIPTVTVNAVYKSPELPKSKTTTATGTTVDTSPESDEMVTLLNQTLPQVHTLYYYNVSTGVVASTLRNPSFFRVQQTDSAKPTYATVKDNGDPLVAPVLMFTAYLVPMDAESKWAPRDLWPGVTLGFSLASPSDTFYFGGSSEIRRNVQLVYGLNYAKINDLAPAGFMAPTSSTAPTTLKVFGKGAFVGFTFNIDFIKGLFSSSKSSSP